MDDFSKIGRASRIEAKSRGGRNQSRYNGCSRRLVRYGTGQPPLSGRFILNDIKKQAGDLCAQIVLSPGCSSTT